MAWKTLFCGTPEFAVPSAQLLFDSELYSLQGLLTQPDRPSGRGQKTFPCAVKEFGLKKGIPCFSPPKASGPSFIQQLKEESFDLAIVAAYGQILSQDFLDLFPKGCFNIHGSLLPQWRGAAPVQRALMAGDVSGGVCLQKMVFQLDAGAIVGSFSMDIPRDLGAVEYFSKLSFEGARLLQTHLPEYLAGEYKAQPQDEAKATYAKKISKAEAELSWSCDGLELHNKVRGLEAGPQAWCQWRGKRLKILKTLPVPSESSLAESGRRELCQAELGPEGQTVSGSGPEPGIVLKVCSDSFWVSTGSTPLEILRLQPPGKKVMSGGDFARGYQLKKGDGFGDTV